MRKNLLPKLYSYLGNNQFLSLAGNLTVSAMSLISVSLLFRALPARETGMWVFFMTTVGLADAFRAGFLTTAFIRACSGAAAERAAEVIGSAWTIALAITALLGLLNLLGWLALHMAGSSLSHPVSGEVTLVLRWFGIVLLLTLPYFIATCVFQAEMRFDRILYIRLLSQGLFVLGIIGLMLTGTTNLERVAYCYVGASLFTSLLTLVLGWARLGSITHRTSFCVSELAHFGKFSVGSYVGATLLRSSDSFLINFLLGPAALAIYNLASRFMELIEVPLRSFVATAIPALSAAFNRHQLPEVARLLRKNAGMLTWAFVPIIVGALLFANIPVALIGGSKYHGTEAGTEAANLLRITMMLSIFYPMDRFMGITLDVVNQPRLNLIKVFLMLFVNVTGDLIALRLFHNIYGVALASLPTVVTGFFFGYSQLKKFLPLSIKGILVTGFMEIKQLAVGFLNRKSSLNPG